VAQRRQFVDFDTVQRHDEFLGFAESNLVGSSSGPSPLSYAFSDVERHAAGSASHLAPQVSFATGKLGRKASNFSIQLQCASVDVELVEFVPTSAVLWLDVRGACAVTVTVTVTVIRWVRHGLSSANSIEGLRDLSLLMRGSVGLVPQGAQDCAGT
jgi:hypothetical protein